MDGKIDTKKFEYKCSMENLGRTGQYILVSIRNLFAIDASRKEENKSDDPNEE